MKIDLRSDTVTRPTPAMLEAMFNARVGDDVFGEDPAMNELEQKAADRFGREAALFCPSGTMTNQIAIKVHTRPGDEVICDQTAHVYNYEGGGIGFNSGCSARLLQGDKGRFKASDVEENIHSIHDVHRPLSRLVVIENTCNRGGGSIWNMADMAKIRKTCDDHGLALHLDGARLFNALAETGESPAIYGKVFDSISICLSKGLGAPVGSLLIGDQNFVKQSRRIRKVLGGGMRQAGYLAAAGIYALEHHVERLKEDHRRAKYLGAVISGLPYVDEVFPIPTNIIIFRLANHTTAAGFAEKMRERDILVHPFSKQAVRLVTHLDFDDAMLEKTEQALKIF